jgi:hypothetical protein
MKARIQFILLILTFLCAILGVIINIAVRLANPDMTEMRLVINYWHLFGLPLVAAMVFTSISIFSSRRKGESNDR